MQPGPLLKMLQQAEIYKFQYSYIKLNGELQTVDGKSRISRPRQKGPSYESIYYGLSCLRTT